MTFEQLLYAEVLSHHSSMQTAADILHITKSGLSLAIHQLEDELGVKIFERTSKGTVVTAAGMQMLSAVSSVLHAKNALVSAADTLSDPAGDPEPGNRRGLHRDAQQPAGAGRGHPG